VKSFVSRIKNKIKIVDDYNLTVPSDKTKISSTDDENNASFRMKRINLHTAKMNISVVCITNLIAVIVKACTVLSTIGN
jgi:hypothetical protein